MSGDPKRVVLAYSGGLDTTACIRYLKERMGCAFVVAMTADLGQHEDLERARRRALQAGADQAVVLDLRGRFAEHFARPALRANAVYAREYPLASALGRPLIGEALVEQARRFACGSVAHGSTGVGNDQVRFDMTIQLLAPDLRILAPAREWSMTRADEVAYLARAGIHADVSAARPWAVDANVLGRNVEEGALADLTWEPGEEVWAMTADPSRPLEPDYREIGYEHGDPVSVDGRRLDLLRVVEELNRVAGAHGVGRIDTIEDRVVGTKSRELYEAPGVTALLRAHRDLERLTLPGDVLAVKRRVEVLYGDLVYRGQWFGPLRDALDGFVERTQRHVRGRIRLRLAHGRVDVVGRESPCSLVGGSNTDAARLAAASRGFIDVLGESGRTWARLHARDSG